MSFILLLRNRWKCCLEQWYWSQGMCQQRSNLPLFEPNRSPPITDSRVISASVLLSGRFAEHVESLLHIFHQQKMQEQQKSLLLAFELSYQLWCWRLRNSLSVFSHLKRRIRGSYNFMLPNPPCAGWVCCSELRQCAAPLVEWTRASDDN